MQYESSSSQWAKKNPIQFRKEVTSPEISSNVKLSSIKKTVKRRGSVLRVTRSAEKRKLRQTCQSIFFCLKGAILRGQEDITKRRSLKNK